MTRSCPCMRFLVCSAVVLLMGVYARPVSAVLTGDPIVHETSFPFLSPPDTFTGPGVPTAPMAGPLIVDISTSTIVPGAEYWVTYDFGLPVGPPPTPGPGFIETHDLEWVGVPAALPPVIKFWGIGGAIAAFAGPSFLPVSPIDVEPSGGGFTVGVLITDTLLLGSGDGYLIQIGDPHGPGGGALPPPPGYSFLGEIIIPEPAALSLLSVGVLALLRRRA